MQRDFTIGILECARAITLVKYVFSNHTLPGLKWYIYFSLRIQILKKYVASNDVKKLRFYA